MTYDGHMPPTPPVKPASGSPFRRLSVVWIVPTTALIAVLGVAIQTYMARGPLIEITFDNASGISAGATELHYRDVTVGTVEDVGFTDALASVVVSVRLNKDVAEFVDSDARFWVVRPQVTAQGVSGLDTVLSGVFIEAIWDSVPGGLQTEFTGLVDAPLERLNTGGVLLTLRAAAGVSLTDGAPILYQGIKVGQIGKTMISHDGSTAEAEAIIFAPHHRLIDSATRFWDASGFSFTLGPGGAALDFSSIASLISGGITFGTLVSGGEPVESGATMTVFADENTARSSIFSGEEGKTLNLSAVFEENIAGLTVDAPVELAGLNIGRVSALNGLVDRERFGDNRVRLIATLAIQPGKLGLDGDQTEETALDFLADRVKNGLRARLATTSILTGGLKVELTEVPDAAPAEMGEMGAAGPSIPTTQSDVSDVSATAEGVFQRINDLPVEEIMKQAISLLGNINALMTSEGVRNAPENLSGLLADARGVINSDDVKGLPGQLSATIGQLSGLVESFNQQEVAARLGKALDDAGEAAASVNTAVEGVPDLIARIEAVAANVEKVGLETMGNQVTELLITIDTLLNQEGTQKLPERVTTALDDLSGLLADARGLVNSDGVQGLPGQLGDTIDQLADLITSFNQQELAVRLGKALDDAAEAAAGVNIAVEGVPDLLARLNGVAANIEEVAIDKMADQMTELLTTVDSFLNQQNVRELPDSLNTSLTELSAVLADLRAAGVVDTVKDTLTSASNAADAVAGASRDLPRLIEQARQVLAQAGTTIEGYEANKGLGRDARNALREVERAAQAVSSLARAIERNPNYLLTGK